MHAEPIRHRWNRTLAILVLTLCLGSRAAAFVQVGQPTGLQYYPFNGWVNDARIQFIVPGSQIDAEGELVTLDLLFTEASSPDFTFTMKLQALPPADSLLTTPFFRQVSAVPVWTTFMDPAAPGWLTCYGYEGLALARGENLLVDICVHSDTPAFADNVLASWTRPNSTIVAQGTTACSTFLGTASSELPVIRLSGLRRHVSGTWLADSEILIDGDLLVPAGETLTIEPGVQVTMEGYHTLEVAGALVVNGLEQSPVLFTALDAELGWEGIFGDEGAPVSLSHTVLAGARHHEIYSANPPGTTTGAIRTGGYAPVVLRNVRIEDCHGSHRRAFLVGSSVEVDGLVFQDCPSEGLNVPLLFVHASEPSEISGVSVEGEVSLDAPTFELTGTISLHHCVLPVTGMGGADSEFNGDVLVDYCTFRFLDGLAKLNVHGASTIRNSVFLGADGLSRIQPVNAELLYHHNLMNSAVPVIADPNSSVTLGPGNLVGEALLLAGEWQLDPASLGVDAASSLDGLDPDLTRVDMGAVPADQSVPVLTTLQDVPGDQGRRLQLAWQAGSMDVAALGEYGFYSVWRQDLLAANRSLGGPVIRALAQLETVTPSAREGLRWQRDDGSVWSFVTTVPAMRIPGYGYVAATLQDSSATGAHPTSLKVGWHCSSHVSESAPDSASSVDNIPPDAPTGFHAGLLAGSELPLRWNPVTTGTLDGNSYPELGLIVYQLYYGSEPDFPCDPAHLVALSTEPRALMQVPEGAPKGFWKVRARDAAE
ncbi:MAG: hypothetical protein H6678_11590 [Candidatus Delongbacteria bacterium]|nr:hypothetical protein [Candidatus Delongbacteria bacterium]